MSSAEKVVLVDLQDREVGAAGKLEAHRSGALHRAFSVFVFDGDGRVLLQRRALEKYHTGGLWSNTCCGHPRPGEELEAAAQRRLREEMGLGCTLERRFGFVYQAEVGGGLVEHEYDHVLVGYHDGEPQPDPSEVADWRWAGLSDVNADLRSRPAEYTPWFPLVLRGLLARDRQEWGDGEDWTEM